MKVNILYQDKINLESSSKILSKSFLSQYSRDCVKELSNLVKRIIPDISIIFVDEVKIKKMNLQYRSINESTDVLSFKSEEDGYLGDIVISIDVVKRYANEFNCLFEDELKRDILHGLMHLLGYDHKYSLNEGKDHEEMFIIQERILNKLK